MPSVSAHRGIAVAAASATEVLSSGRIAVLMAAASSDLTASRTALTSAASLRAAALTGPLRHVAYCRPHGTGEVSLVGCTVGGGPAGMPLQPLTTIAAAVSARTGTTPWLARPRNLDGWLTELLVHYSGNSVICVDQAS